MKRIFTLCAVLLMAFGFNVNAQDAPAKPFTVGVAATVTKMPSIASRAQLFPSTEKEGSVQDGRASKNLVVPGKGNSFPDLLLENQHKSTNTVPGKMPSIVFETAFSNSQPTDPSGAVGPDHYFAVFNTGFRIFDKAGIPLTGQLGVNNIFPASGCCDLTVSYDNLADRWVVSFLGNGIQIAVSEGPDPVNTEWNVYNFPQVADYNKLSVWRDGYYITENTVGSNKLWVLERDAALAGDAGAQMAGFALPGIVTSGFHSPQAMNITDDNHPTEGGCPIVYMQDDAWNGVATDHVKLWTATMDWDTPANSEVSQPLIIETTPYISVFDNGSFSNLFQPNGGTKIDALQATIMNQSQFRKFGSHNSAIFNFVIDTDPAGGESKLAGIRWMELRQDTDDGAWSLYQEGTYVAPDNRHTWHGGMAMDGQGNIGLGFTAMASPTTTADGSDPAEPIVVSSWYTGRFASDPLGTMTIDATLIAAGMGNIPGTRYGDYSKMDVDPVDDKGFWFINEYIGTSGRGNVAGVFQIAPNSANDVGVTNISTPETGTLTATEEITVTVFNFGENDATGFDVTYQLDGGAVVTQAYAGTLASTTAAEFTFTTPADLSVEGQTYSIEASTVYATDEDNDNDAITKEVTHLFSNDTGVTALLSPVSGGLGVMEQVQVEITNFGGATQTDIPVYYTIDGGTAVEETYTGSIESGATDTYMFAATEDLAAIGDYVIVTGTELAGDADETNDDLTSTVSSFICRPEGNCAGFNDGVTFITLADQDITVECGSGDVTGYADNSDVIFNFVLDNNPFEGVLQMGFADSVYALWIDFNDNNAFEPEELISNEQVALGDTDFNFTIDFTDFADVVTIGMHKMRLRGEDESTAGEVTDPCDDLQFGRTNDFTANITGTLGLNDADFGGTDVQINYLANDQYEVVFENNISFNERLPITVFNTVGQKLAYYTIENTGGTYRKTIDMSYVAAGVYFVQVGNETLNKTKKIIVQ